MFLVSLGFVVVAVIAVLPGKFNQQGKIDRIRAESEEAKIREKEGFVPSHNNLIVSDYVSNSQTPPQISLAPYSDNDRVIVYDSKGVCVGMIDRKLFRWKGNEPTVCNGQTNLNTKTQGNKLHD